MTSEKNLYNYPESTIEGNAHIVLATKRARWGPCTWISLATLIVAVCVLVVVILILMTLSGHKSHMTHEEPLDEIAKFSQIAKHNDTVPPIMVLTAIKTGAPKVCILDTAYLVNSPLTAFFQEHIASAQHFDINRVTMSSSTKRYNLVHPLIFQSYARSLGISDDCYVVVYDHGEDFLAASTATYVWWLFKVYGHEKVSVLQGGLRKWKFLNYDLHSGRTEEPRFGHFHAKWNPKWIMTYSDVFRKVRTEQLQVVDTRPAAKFNGKRKHSLANLGGRIREAVYLPMTDLLDANTWGLKPRDEVRKVLKYAGITREKTKLIYGDTGLRASIVLFAMIQENFRAILYNGGWIEWSHLAPTDWTVT